MENKLKILVVEDMQTMRTIVKRFLEKSGHEVVEASNGKEALKALLVYENIDLILLDYMMPELDGPGFLQKFNAFRADCKTKVCMMTAIENPNEVRKCLESGADDYIVKPIDQNTLNEKVKILVQGSSSEQFATVKCKLSGTILKPQNCAMLIIAFTESQITIESNLAFQIGDQIEIESKYLNMILGEKRTFFIRVYSCEKTSSKSTTRATFTGLKEETIKRIRSLAIKGEEIYE